MRAVVREQYCGVGFCRPQFVQRWANVQVFTLFSSLVVAVQGMYLGYLISVLTTIERRFQIQSSKSGALLSVYDIGHALSVLIIGHFGSHLHQPKWIAIGAMFSSVACFGLALPHFIFDNGQDLKADGSLSNDSLSLCTEQKYLNNSNNGAVDTHASDTAAYSVLIVFQTLAGFASCAFTTLTYVYIDNNCSKKQAPFYLGIVTAMWGYGPAAGFGLGALVARVFHTLDAPPSGITPSSPAWIGAWWLGLVICGGLYILVGLPFICFPQSLKRHRLESDRSRVETDLLALPDLRQASDHLKMRERQQCLKSTFWIMKKIAALPLEVWRLLKNPMFTTMTIFWIFDSYVIGGYFTFMPKYLEVQFGESASMANVWSGLISVFGYATAIGIGGKILSYFNPSPATGILLVLVTTFHNVITDLVLILVGCPNTIINGINPEIQSISPLNLSQPVCQTDCVCDPSSYYPVCAADATYFSPCHAGCSTTNQTAAHDLMFSSCVCVTDTIATAGACPNECGTRLTVFLIGSFSGAFVAALFDMATYTSMIWAVPPKKKAITIALANFLCSVFGFMPSQVIFGALIDTTCALWSSDGYCQLYDNGKFRTRFHLATSAFLFACCVALFIGWRFAKTFKFLREDDEKDSWEEMQSFVISDLENEEERP